jgi:hypothetical protein
MAGAPTCDEAIDLDYVPTPSETNPSPPSLSRLLSDYARSRSDADRDALPVRDGMALTLFEVQPLTARQLRWVGEARTDTEASHRAFLCACLRVVLPGGQKELSTTIPGDAFAARPEWIDDVVFPRFGQDAMDEVARVAIERAKAGPRARLPFSLPPGLMLPR